MTPQGSPQPLLARKRCAAGAAPLLAEPMRSDSDNDGSCDLQQTSHATWLLSEGTPEQQRGRSGSPLSPAKSVSLLPSPSTEPETLDDSEDDEDSEDGVHYVDIDELLGQAAFRSACISLARDTKWASKECADIVARAVKELRKPIQQPAAFVHGKQKKVRGTVLFYTLLIKRVRDLDYFCPDASDPVVQTLCDSPLSLGVPPAQAVTHRKKKLRKELKTLPQQRAYSPGGSVQLPPQPPRSISARYRRVSVKYGLTMAAN